RSRAMTRLRDNCVLRMPPNSVYTVETEAGGKPAANVNRGSVYLFIRDLFGASPARSELASAATRGTEFHLSVEADGRSVFTVIDGEVDVQNQLGQITLVSGQEAAVQPGGKPERTAALEVTRVIQWCLYYPAVVDPAEWPFTPEENRRLADSL